MVLVDLPLDLNWQTFTVAGAADKRDLDGRNPGGIVLDRNDIMAAVTALAPRRQFVAPRQGLAVKAVHELLLLDRMAGAAIDRLRRLMRKIRCCQVRVATGAQGPAMTRGLEYLLVDKWRAVLVAMTGQAGVIINNRRRWSHAFFLGEQ